MPKTDEAIVRDLRNWSEDKLFHWFKDSMTRYEMADIAVQNGVCYALATLIMAVGDITSEFSIDPEMIGRDIATYIKHAQKKKAVKS